MSDAIDKLRPLLGDRPILRIALVLCLLVFAGLVAARWWNRARNPYTFERLTQEITLVCRETGEEIKMPRGRMEQMLWDRPRPLDPSLGLINPGTGRPTLFPKSEWEITIERINREREMVAESRGRSRPARDD